MTHAHPDDAFTQGALTLDEHEKMQALITRFAEGSRLRREETALKLMEVYRCRACAPHLYAELAQRGLLEQVAGAVFDSVEREVLAEQGVVTAPSKWRAAPGARR